MKASIIITTYNRPLFLERAIKSILAQTFCDCEIVVIDDNGKGTTQQIETGRIVKEYKTVIYHVLQENKGACEARNIGVKLALGEYIFFLDDDDTYKTNKIETQVSYMEQHSHFDGCLTAMERIDSDGNIVIAPANFPNVGDFVNFAVHGNFFTPMLCIKKSSFETIGGFKKIARFQDRFLMLHCLLKGQVFGIINEPLYTLYDHTEERITASDLNKTIICFAKVNNLIESKKSKFSKIEWVNYRYSYMRQVAIAHYVQSAYSLKIKGITYWVKLFFMKYKFSDLLMVFKSLIP